MEEVRNFFAARGIGTSELAKGLVIHEVCLKYISTKYYDHIFCVAGAWSSNSFLSLGRLLLCKAFSQVPLSNQLRPVSNQSDI